MENPEVGAIDPNRPNADKPPAHDDLVTIAGGVDLEVTHLDGSKETVKVRQVPISKIQQFILAAGWGNDAQVVEIACGKPEGWADTLELQSASDVADKAVEINQSFVEAWSRRQAKWKKIFGVPETADGAKKKPENESPSASSAPKSPTTTNAIPGT